MDILSGLTLAAPAGLDAYIPQLAVALGEWWMIALVVGVLLFVRRRRRTTTPAA